MTTYLSKKAIPSNERLIFALDVATIDEAKQMIEALGDSVVFYKIGLELFMTGEYYDLIEYLKARGKKVFADLKFFDVPQTVASAVKQLNHRQVDFVTVHGNHSILEAAAKAKTGALKVLGVTVLTSLDQGDLNDLGFQCDVESLVLSRAKRTLETGCDGIIASGLEAPAIRAHVDEKLLVITPGIRPVENKPVDDQKRTVDVKQAFLNGADYIVVGRPIKNAPDPKQAAAAIQATIAALFA